MIPFWPLVMVIPISFDDLSHIPHPFVDCTNDFEREDPFPQTQTISESSSLYNKSSYVVGLPFQPLDMVSSPSTFSPNKELEVILSSSENLAPLYIKISISIILWILEVNHIKMSHIGRRNPLNIKRFQLVTRSNWIMSMSQ